MTYYGCALTRQFEALKVFVLNSASAITQSKRQTVFFAITPK